MEPPIIVNAIWRKHSPPDRGQAPKDIAPWPIQIFDIAVIGAGMVGTSSALWLQRSGHKVALIDRTGPGTGTSFGNAGAFATYANVPINSPSLPGRLPKLLFARESPLRIDWAHILRMTPWLIQFLKNCSPARVEAISDALSSLLEHSEDGAFPLFKASGADALITLARLSLPL